MYGRDRVTGSTERYTTLAGHMLFLMHGYAILENAAMPIIGDPDTVNNTYVLVVRPDTAQKHKLQTLSDLARVSKELKLGAGPEFRDRKDGIPGLKAKYDMDFKEDLQLAIGLRYQALKNDQIQIVNGYATDGMISAMKLTRLKDDKNLWPPYFVVPVVRKEVLDANPKVAAVLNRVSAMLDETTVAEMNYRVDGEKMEPKDVARDFLKAKGVVK